MSLSIFPRPREVPSVWDLLTGTHEANYQEPYATGSIEVEVRGKLEGVEGGEDSIGCCCGQCVLGFLATLFTRESFPSYHYLIVHEVSYQLILRPACCGDRGQRSPELRMLSAEPIPSFF